MELQSISNRYFTLDEVLRDIPETDTDVVADIEDAYQSYKEELNEELKTTDRVWLEFQAGQCEQFGHAAKSLLYRIVKSSIGHPENSVAAANAITILKVMGVSFSYLDLRKIQIPEADLSEAILNNANMSNAILKNVNFINSSMSRIDCTESCLKNIRLGEQYTYRHKTYSYSCEYVAFDSSVLIVDDAKNSVYIWNFLDNSTTEFPIDVDINMQTDIYTPIDFSIDPDYIKKIIDNPKYTPIYTNITVLLMSMEKAITLSDELYCTLEELYSGGTYKPIIWKVDRAERTVKMRNWKNSAYFRTKNSISGFAKQNIPMWISPNGKDLILFSDINMALVWQLDTIEKDKVKFILKKIEKLPMADNVHFSPKGSIILMVYSDSLRILEFSTFTEIANYPIKNIDNVKFSDDEKGLFFNINTKLYYWRLWDEHTKQWSTKDNEEPQLVLIEKSYIQRMQPIPNTSQLLYFVMNGDISICDLANVNSSRRGFIRTEEHLDDIGVFSDCKYICAISGEEITVWNIDNIREQAVTSSRVYVKAISFSHDNKISMLNSRLELLTYNVHSGQYHSSKDLKKNLEFNSTIEQRLDIADLNNGDYVLFYRDGINKSDQNTTEFFLYSLKDDKIFYFSSIRNHKAYALCDACEYAAFVIGSLIRLYKIQPTQQLLGNIILEESCNPNLIVLSQNVTKDMYIASADSTHIILWKVGLGEQQLNVLYQTKIKHNEQRILNMRFVQDSSSLVIIGNKKIIRWEIEKNTTKEIQLEIGDFEILTGSDAIPAISQSGNLICFTKSNVKSKQLCLLDLESEKILDTTNIPTKPMGKIYFSFDNLYIVAKNSLGESCYIYQIFDGKLRLLWRTIKNLVAYEVTISKQNDLDKKNEAMLINYEAIKV